ncbi:hypothetical protein [Wolbachia endosymbiont of Pentidionis agamae]|uniref:hypothetical protein n=1 Tax=Wolbachia endosymbiont of Pentidionis agamae TaxID=3110435 RepID=UPI002FD384D9
MTDNLKKLDNSKREIQSDDFQSDKNSLQQNMHMQKLMEFKKLHDYSSKNRNLDHRVEELKKLDEECTIEHPEIRIDERSNVIPYRTFCAHGTNAWTIFSSLAFTNGSLLPKNEMRKVGIPLVAGERRGSKNYSLINQNFISTVALDCLTADLYYVYDYANRATKEYKQDYDVLKRKYLKRCITNKGITDLLNDKILQEAYETLYDIPIVVLGDGIGESHIRSDISNEVVYERFNIRVILVREQEKEYVQNLIHSIDQKITILTKEEVDDFHENRKKEKGYGCYENSFSYDFQKVFADKLHFNFSTEFSECNLKKKRIIYKRSEGNTLKPEIYDYYVEYLVPNKKVRFVGFLDKNLTKITTLSTCGIMLATGITLCFAVNPIVGGVLIAVAAAIYGIVKICNQMKNQNIK